MPHFPSPPPNIPKTLLFFNPKHHLLCIKWIFFQREHILHYLYQAAPDLYLERGLWALLKLVRSKSYRNLILISFFASLFPHIIYFLIPSFGNNENVATIVKIISTVLVIWGGLSVIVTLLFLLTSL